MSKYSYVTVNIQSHGYMVRTNEDFAFDGVEYGEDLIICGYSDATHHPKNVRIKRDEVTRLVWDRRGPDASSYVFVYRAGKTKDEVFFLLRPQLRKVLRLHMKAYQQLAANFKQMISAPLADDVLCKGVNDV